MIHSLNKNEHALDMAAPVHERLGDMDGWSYWWQCLIEEENQCFLLGDHTGDLGMSDGLNYEPCQISVLLITWVTCN